MPPAATEVYDQGAAVLAAVVAGYAEAGVALPAKQYVAEGPPAYDCEQVVVAFARLRPGLPGASDVTSPDMQRATLPRVVTWAVHVVRCVPVQTGKRPPSATQLGDSAAGVLTDASVLPRSVVNAWRAGDLASCSGLAVLEVAPAGPEGGVAGTVLTLDAQL